jgi:hypothetical protein
VRRWRVACFTLLGLAALGPGVARAADPRVQQDLEQAEQSLVNLDYDAANKTASRVALQRGLSHEQLIRVYRVLALTNAVLDKETASRDAFQQLLTYDPTYAGDPNLGPKVQGPFLEARGYLRAQAVQPGIDVAVVLRPAEPGTIRVTTRDPLHIAKHATVGFRWGADAAFTSAQVAVGEGATASVPPPPTGTTRLDYYVQVLDDRDDVIFDAGTPASPKSATVDLAAAVAAPAVASASQSEHHSVFASPVFWTIAGIVVAGAATGVYFATRGTTTTTQALAPTGANLSSSAQCGLPPGSCH